MPSPVLPSDVDAIVPTATGSLCDKFTKALLRFPALFAQWFSWAFDSSGNVTNEFRTQLIRPGDYIFSANSTPPTGAVVCNGGAISRATYSNLFSVIGTTYGSGDGVSTYNVPDFTDRFPRGNGATLPGAVGGADTDSVTLVEANIPSHVHSIGIDGSGNAEAVTEGKFRTNGGVDISFISGSSAKSGITQPTGDGTAFDVDTVPEHLGIYIFIQG